MSSGTSSRANHGNGKEQSPISSAPTIGLAQSLQGASGLAPKKPKRQSVPHRQEQQSSERSPPVHSMSFVPRDSSPKPPRLSHSSPRGISPGPSRSLSSLSPRRTRQSPAFPRKGPRAGGRLSSRIASEGPLVDPQEVFSFGQDAGNYIFLFLFGTTFLRSQLFFFFSKKGKVGHFIVYFHTGIDDTRSSVVNADATVADFIEKVRTNKEREKREREHCLRLIDFLGSDEISEHRS